MSSPKPVAFKWRHFHQEIILQCVRWYCKYGISYRALEEMMRERGIVIDQRRFIDGSNIMPLNLKTTGLV